MNKEDPEYLVMNPTYSGLKKDVLTQHQIQLGVDFFGDIQAIRIKVPIKLRIDFTNSDKTNIESYYLKDFIETSFQ
tara:strand:+ start:256 stop:483 length:228 start_codon:yes stop_codon:yes gene_type:complete